MLEAYLDQDGPSETFVPPWLNVKDVTGDTAYSMYMLARFD